VGRWVGGLCLWCVLMLHLSRVLSKAIFSHSHIRNSFFHSPLISSNPGSFTFIQASMPPSSRESMMAANVKDDSVIYVCVGVLLKGEMGCWLHLVGRASLLASLPSPDTHRWIGLHTGLWCVPRRGFAVQRIALLDGQRRAGELAVGDDDEERGCTERQPDEEQSQPAQRLEVQPGSDERWLAVDEGRSSSATRNQQHFPACCSRWQHPNHSAASDIQPARTLSSS